MHELISILAIEMAKGNPTIINVGDSTLTLLFVTIGGITAVYGLAFCSYLHRIISL